MKVGHHNARFLHLFFNVKVFHYFFSFLIVYLVIGSILVISAQEPIQSVILDTTWVNAHTPRVIAIHGNSADTFSERNQIPPQVNLTAQQVGPQAQLVVPKFQIDRKAIDDNYRALPVIFEANTISNEKLKFNFVYYVTKAMTYEKSSGFFEGALSFFLQRDGNNVNAGILKEPLVLRLIAKDVDEISPVEMKVDRMREFNSVVFKDDHPVEFIEVNFIASYLNRDYKLKIPVLPNLTSTSTSYKIPGFGLGSVEIPFFLEGIGPGSEIIANVDMLASAGLFSQTMYQLAMRLPVL